MFRHTISTREFADKGEPVKPFFYAKSVEALLRESFYAHSMVKLLNKAKSKLNSMEELKARSSLSKLDNLRLGQEVFNAKQVTTLDPYGALSSYIEYQNVRTLLWAVARSKGMDETEFIYQMLNEHKEILDKKKVNPRKTRLSKEFYATLRDAAGVEASRLYEKLTKRYFNP